jgi:uncharacterized membrane protein
MIGDIPDPVRSAALALALVGLGSGTVIAQTRSELFAGNFDGGAADVVDAAMHVIATGVEIAGVTIIVIGAMIAAYLFLREGLSSQNWSSAYGSFRANLGRGILLGLEFLVAADIIGTVAVKPTFESLGVLAAIVLIRTFLSVSLEVEIEGRWPWRRKAHGP